MPNSDLQPRLLQRASDAIAALQDNLDYIADTIGEPAGITGSIQINSERSLSASLVVYVSGSQYRLHFPGTRDASQFFRHCMAAQSWALEQGARIMEPTGD